VSEADLLLCPRRSSGYLRYSGVVGRPHPQLQGLFTGDFRNGLDSRWIDSIEQVTSSTTARAFLMRRRCSASLWRACTCSGWTATMQIKSPRWCSGGPKGPDEPGRDGELFNDLCLWRRLGSSTSEIQWDRWALQARAGYEPGVTIGALLSCASLAS